VITGTVDLGAGITDGTVTVDGDPADLQRLIDLLARVDPNFAEQLALHPDAAIFTSRPRSGMIPAAKLLVEIGDARG
jgi:transposase